MYECVAPSVFNTIVANNPISSDEFSLGNSFSLLHKFAKCAVSTLIKHDFHYLIYADIHLARIHASSRKKILLNDSHLTFSKHVTKLEILFFLRSRRTYHLNQAQFRFSVCICLFFD